MKYRKYITALLPIPLILCEAFAEEPEIQPPPVPEPVVGAAPPEEVMRPTTLGVRLTPEIARGIARNWIQEELGEELALDQQQEEQLAGAFSDRMLRLAHGNQERLQSFVESFLETALKTHGRFSPESSQDFARQSGPVAPVMREFLDGVAEDARPVLRPDQLPRFEEELSRQRRAVDRFEQRVNAWSRGEYKEGENLLQDLEAEYEADKRPGEQVSPELRRARQMARWSIRHLGTQEWARFLNAARFLFKFDAAQTARGDALLAEYRAKADAIMTPEWKERIQRNRTQANMRFALQGFPTGPWLFRLDREYETEIQPIHDLGREFRSAVLDLATPQQRTAVLADVRATAEKHGLPVDDTDAALLRLTPQTAPAGAAPGS